MMHWFTVDSALNSTTFSASGLVLIKERSPRFAFTCIQSITFSASGLVPIKPSPLPSDLWLLEAFKSPHNRALKNSNKSLSKCI